MRNCKLCRKERRFQPEKNKFIFISSSEETHTKNKKIHHTSKKTFFIVKDKRAVSTNSLSCALTLSRAAAMIKMKYEIQMQFHFNLHGCNFWCVFKIVSLTAFHCHRLHHWCILKNFIASTMSRIIKGWCISKLKCFVDSLTLICWSVCKKALFESFPCYV